MISKDDIRLDFIVSEGILMPDLDEFYGPNAGYVIELYERYLENPDSIDEASRTVFNTWSPIEQKNSEQTLSKPVQSQEVSMIVAASELAHAIRSRGHLGAQLDPLGTEPLGDPALLAETHGISDQELSQLPPEVVGGHSAEGVQNALEAMNALRTLYSGTISYEFDQVKSPLERGWLRDAVGLRLYRMPQAVTFRRKLLQRLTQVEVFERFLHQTYPGQKRFSLEGTDVLVPMLDEIIRVAINSNTSEIIIGMAHRGRLNVLAHVLEKPYVDILGEFGHMKHEEGVPLTDSFGYGYTGDVKYHLGAETVHEEGDTVELRIILSPNPSHLEFVDPVVEGMTRASQERVDHAGEPSLHTDHSLPILIHGDAAFPGEGIVAETLNLWNLRGYTVGGTIHLMVNNQLGFTTEPEDYRSTYFASDLAKGFEVPIIHVNADDPEAALMAVRIAHGYRTTFQKDVLIDLVGYRRWGHNEGDEPSYTQPQMYEIIRSHPTVRELYARTLQSQGAISDEEVEKLQQNAFETLEKAKREADARNMPFEQEDEDGQNGQEELEQPAAISARELTIFNAELLTWPEDFSPNPKLARLLQRRATTLGAEGGIDWGQAEALAFASILSEGISIRLTGQDVERGTFSHRHAVLHDHQSGEIYIPLQHLSQARASFSIYNSPLSESSVLGFEYGFSVHAPNTLVIWEAQFGDFANVAQPVIDQFIASGRSKWRQQSSLVLLLPHGYEGQGPEHSSARLERYLELAALDNWRIANCTTAAQYYHLLRLHARNLLTYPRPLVIMTPKSLLRHPLASSYLQDLEREMFITVLDDSLAQKSIADIRRVVLCSGKIGIELLAHKLRDKVEGVAVVRVEMLYPFPAQALKAILDGYEGASEVVWVQEEPLNMGAWGYMSSQLTSLLRPGVKLSVISRPPRPSPATGFSDLFQFEQEHIIEEAYRTTVTQYGGEYGD
jgi:2-oxoglutarate dehydrogenase E1 component